MLFWTRHANLRRVENYIYDPSARIIKNPLNSTVFWKRRLNPATRRLNSATRPLNSATRQILHWNIVVYFDEASSQLGKASSQLGDASAQLRDASKMQLWPQWLTIQRGVQFQHMECSNDVMFFYHSIVKWIFRIVSLQFHYSLEIMYSLFAFFQ